MTEVLKWAFVAVWALAAMAVAWMYYQAIRFIVRGFKASR